MAQPGLTLEADGGVGGMVDGFMNHKSMKNHVLKNKSQYLFDGGFSHSKMPTVHCHVRLPDRREFCEMHLLCEHVFCVVGFFVPAPCFQGLEHVGRTRDDGGTKFERRKTKRSA